MQKKFRIEVMPGSLKNSYLQTGELRAYLPESVFGGDGRNEPAKDVVRLIVKGKTFETDVPRKHPHRFKSRTVAAEVIFLLDLKAGDTMVYREIAPLTFEVTKESEVGEPVEARRSPADPASGDLLANDRVQKWVEREARPEQQKFRRGIVQRDGLRCAITGCQEASVLDAAHLRQRAKDGSDDPANGIILRSDIHRLFDAGLLVIDPISRTVAVAPQVSFPDYLMLCGLTVSTGANLSVLGQTSS